ncbi:MAG: O-antigen ligase family protein [Sulfurospirillum sp.]
MTKIEKLMHYLLLILAFTLPLSESIKTISLVLFILVGFYATYKKEIVPELDFLNIVTLLIPFVILIGSYFAVDVKNSIEGSNTVVTMSIMFIYVREMHWSHKKIKNLLTTLFAGFVVTLIWGYYDLIIQHKRFLELHSVGEVNHSSIYMLLIFILSLVYLAIEYKKLSFYNTTFISITCLSSIISVFVTGSRATMYSSLGIILIFGIYSMFKLDKKILVLLSFILILIGLLFFLNIDSRMIQKFEKGIFNNMPRVNLAISFFNVWLGNNIPFGIGIDNSNLIHLKEYYINSIFLHMGHAHDTYITYLVERGLVGLFLYLAFILYLLVTLIKKLKKDQYNVIIIASILIWIVNFIISFANTTFHHENAILMLLIWAIATNLPYDEKNTLNSSQ